MGELLNLAQEITQYLVNRVDEIDLVYLYGGVAQGREHPRSDIEMSAVSEKKQVRWEFILDERPIFIWPQTWKQLETVSAGKEGCWSIAAASIVHAKILWSKSDEEREKFLKIQSESNLGAKSALKRSINSFDELYGKLWRVQKAIEAGRKLDTTFLVWGIANGIVNVLAALNNRFLLNNWGKQIQELKTFRKMPKNFIERYIALIESQPKEALQIASDLVDDVNVFLKEWILENQVAFKEALEEIVTDWPTVLEYLNKAVSATEQRDISAGLFASCDNAEFNLWAFTTLRNIKWNKSSFFSATEEIKKLPSDIGNNLSLLLESKDLSEIQKATYQLAEQLRRELEEDWTLPESSSLEEALRFLKVY
ncbi:MAG: hypothetical protein PVF15_00125 [Candidatus Bathyarchaeota archaeon]|jgi:hypothetical protein